MPKQVKITPEVREVLQRSTVEGPADRRVLKLNQPGLERSLYEATDKVLRALGGKWDRRAGGHVFTRPLDDELAAALTCGVAVDQVRTAEQFFTPIGVARLMADRLGLPSPHIHHVLEPSAGDGRLVQALNEHGVEHLTVVERDTRLCEKLATLVPPHGSGLFCADFMEWKPVAALPIDAVMMNPPFSRGQDIEHVTRAFQFLRPGGKLVAIMSPHWRFAEDARSKGFRFMANEHAYLWEPLPAAAFRESGTDVSTGILTITKGN